MIFQSQPQTTAATQISYRPPSRPVLQRKCACGGTAGLTGECEECGRKRRLSLQAKLRFGASGDVCEREADRVADQVMAISTHPAVNSAFPQVRRHTSQLQVAQTMDVPASVEQVLAQPGVPLGPALRQSMECRIGHDFSKVRVHSDAAAARSARDVDANAYTVGSHIVFATQQFAPDTSEGQRLLAHELTHVVQQQSVPAIQRQPTDYDPGHPVTSPREGSCKSWPHDLPAYGREALKPTGRDAAIKYSLVVTPGRFCDTNEKSVGLLQYERVVRIRTATGREAILHVVADAALFAPFDARKSVFEQLRTPADVSIRWEVATLYGKDERWNAFVLPGAEGREINHATSGPRVSLAQLAQRQPDFVQFFLSPQQQLERLEKFVEKTATSKVPDDANRPRLKGWGQQRPRPAEELPQRRPSPATLKKEAKKEDDQPLASLSEDQRYDLARQKIWEQTKAKLKYMWEHPGETLKGFGKSLLLLDTPEVFSGIAENLSELFDSEASGWARAAAATEAASKLSGWLAAVAGVLAAILTVIAFATGVGEIAVGLIAIGVALGAVAMSLSGAASVMRAKAASKTKSQAEFDRHVEAGSGDLAGGIVGVAVIIAGTVAHVTAKTVFPKQAAGVRTFFDNLGKRIRSGLSEALGSKKPGVDAPKTGAAPSGATPKLPGIIEKFLDQLERAFGRQPSAAGIGTDIPVPDTTRGMESRSVPPKRTAPATVKDLKPPAATSKDPASPPAKEPKPKQPTASRYSQTSRANLAELDRKFPKLEGAHVTIRKRGTGAGMREESMFTNGGKESYQAQLRGSEKGIQLDDISPDGTVIEIKMRTDVEVLRARWIEEYLAKHGRRELDFETNKHLDENIRADAERAADRYIDTLETKDLEGFEDQMVRHQMFIDENELPGGEWITDSPGAAKVMKDIIARRGLTKIKVRLVK